MAITDITEKTWFIKICSKIVWFKQRLRTLILTMVYLRKRPEFVGWSFCLYIRTVPIRHWNGVNKICLILAAWLFREAQVQSTKAAEDENWRTDSISAFSVAHGTVIMTSHFDIDIIIRTDCTMLLLIDVFGDISFWLLTFCQYLNCTKLQSCHQAFKFVCQFLQTKLN